MSTWTLAAALTFAFLSGASAYAALATRACAIDSWRPHALGAILCALIAADLASRFVV